MMTDTNTVRLTRRVEYNAKWENVGIFQCYSDDSEESEDKQQQNPTPTDEGSESETDSDGSEDLKSAKVSLRPSEGSDRELEEPLSTIGHFSPKKEEESVEDLRLIHRSERATRGKPPERFADEFAKVAKAVTAVNSSKKVFEPSNFQEIQALDSKDAEPMVNVP
ncbi:Hypothetical predicted protein [Podarcis lilfordi]|uniref:Uncharacterized protein n=1 Tax=Podarcis lilfordi TaxID=74358 RepID=A0AA35NYF4_9SAUR|nr:Hypothetical predicted protein [Podarcis lilfordi]